MDNNKLVDSLRKPEVFENDFGSLSITKTFYDEVNNLMERLHLNTTTFCNATELNKTILSDMKKEDYKPQLRTVVTICLGLNLEYIESVELLKVAGYVLVSSRKIDYAYYLLLTKYKNPDLTMEDYNKILAGWGFDKKHYLGSQER